MSTNNTPIEKDTLHHISQKIQTIQKILEEQGENNIIICECTSVLGDLAQQLKEYSVQ